MTKEEFVSKALGYLGYPAMKYVSPEKGRDTNGFDCSGFVTFLLREIGFPSPFPRHCNEYLDSFGMFIQKFQMGDLVFFSLKNGGVYPDHMGIMISDGEFIHSPGKNGARIKTDVLEWRDIKPLGDEIHDQSYTINPIAFKRLSLKRGRYQQFFLS